jgi:hypothetical protein
MAHGLGRKPHPDTARAAELYPIREHPHYREIGLTIAYWGEGGSWLDQGNTGCCVGFSFAHRYADQTVAHEGIDDAWARQLYLDASGDTSLEKGTSAILAARVMKARGQISSYHWVTSADELRNTLMTIGPVLVGTNWYSSMDRPVLGANDRAYLEVDTHSTLRGGHEYVINGINLDPASGAAFYRLKNSWGRGWPADSIDTDQIVYGPGTARIPVEQLEDLIFNHGGDAVLLSENP